jgi:hypothetical protein
MIQRGSSRFGCVVLGYSWWLFSEPSFGDFFGLFSGPCSWGFDGGNLWEPFVVLWAVIPLPNLWVKGLDFGVFRVPRSSGTPVATWAWPTWVVSRRLVLEAMFILLELPSPSRRIFIGSHSLPLSGSPYRSFRSNGAPNLQRTRHASSGGRQRCCCRHWPLHRQNHLSFAAATVHCWSRSWRQCELPTTTAGLAGDVAVGSTRLPSNKRLRLWRPPLAPESLTDVCEDRRSLWSPHW